LVVRGPTILHKLFQNILLTHSGILCGLLLFHPYIFCFFNTYLCNISFQQNLQYLVRFYRRIFI
jgi:hypothetical protein